MKPLEHPGADSRADRLLGLLRARSSWTGVELAAELGISLRTLRRDLARAVERGIPIEADRGRGGGVRLAAGWGLGRLHLTGREVMDLLVALAVAESLRSPLLMQNLRTVRQKLGVALPPEQARNIQGLRRRVLVGRPASDAVVRTLKPPRPSVVSTLQDAFMARAPLVIRHATGGAAPTARTVEPHHLLVNWPAWYVLAWDRLRDGVRTFRVDRVVEARALDGTFSLRPAADMMADVGDFFGQV